MPCCQVQVGAELTIAETQEEEHRLIPHLRQPRTQFTLYQLLFLYIYFVLLPTRFLQYYILLIFMVG